MAGMPGSGKSTLARAIGTALRWPVIDKDTLKSTLLETGIPEDATDPTAYALMFDLARDLLVEQGSSVVLDSPAALQVTLESAQRVAGAAGATLRVVLCLAEQLVRNTRSANRVKKMSQQSWIPSKTAGDGQYHFGHLPAGTLEVATNRPVSELLQNVLTFLRG